MYNEKKSEMVGSVEGEVGVSAGEEVGISGEVD